MATLAETLPWGNTRSAQIVIQIGRQSRAASLSPVVVSLLSYRPACVAFLLHAFEFSAGFPIAQAGCVPAQERKVIGR
jgi:hypothetical protein